MNERSMNDIELPVSAKQPTWLKESAKESPSAFPWGSAFSFGLLCFFLQLLYFESYALTQSNLLRPILEKTCKSLGCTLPTYANVKEFDVLHSSLEKLDGQRYQFIAAINNLSQFKQHYPILQIKLLDYSGRQIGFRRFQASEYLPKQTPSLLIDSQETVEIKLQLLPRMNKIAGYTLALQ